MIGIGKTFTGVFVASVALVVALVVTHEAPRYEARGTFRTTDLIVDNTAAIRGDIGLCTDGTTTCAGIPHLTWHPTVVTGGSTGRMSLSGNYEAFTQLAATTASVTLVADMFCQGTANATATDIACRGGEFDALASRVAGGNNVVNTALTLQAANGQTNTALDSLNGDWRLNGGSFQITSGSERISGALTVDSGGVVDFSAAGAIKLNNLVTSFAIPGSAATRANISIGNATDINDGTQIQTKNIKTADGSVGVDIGLDTTINALIEGGLFITRGAGGSFGSGQKGLWVGPGNILTPAEVANDLTIYNVEASKSILVITGGIGTAHTSFGIRPNGHLSAENVAPTPSACGAGPSPTLVGDDKWFTVHTGAGATGCVVTFAVAFVGIPICTVSAANGTQPAYTKAADSITLGAGTAAAVDYDVHCFARQGG